MGEGRQGAEFAGPSGTVTFLFNRVCTCVADSNRPGDTDTEQPARSLRRFGDIARAAIESNGGYVFRDDEQLAAAFALASKAIQAAERLQVALSKAAWPGPKLQACTGVHLGEAELRGGNYIGPAVRTAELVAADSQGGQILLTEAVRLSSRVKNTVDLGMHLLRGVDEPAHIHRLDIADGSTGQTERSVPDLTPGERRVLLGLCSPIGDLETFTPPATVHAIATELVVTDSAVKQQLSRLYRKFGVDEGPDRRVRLANTAVGCGAVRLTELHQLRDRDAADLIS